MSARFILIAPMSSTRAIYRLKDKIDTICGLAYGEGALPKNTMKQLAATIGVNDRTFKSAVQQGRLSTDIEAALAGFARFAPQDPCWVDLEILDAVRRKPAFEGYRGRDDLPAFDAMLRTAWSPPATRFRAERGSYRSSDAHSVRHSLGDLGQATPVGADMQFFFAATFEPFRHRSGLAFGFRAVTLTLSIRGAPRIRVTSRLGHPQPASLGDATLEGDCQPEPIHWKLRHARDSGVLHGEYTSADHPMITLAGYEDGTALHSRIEVNLWDRAACADPNLAAPSANQEAVLNQIFAKQLPEADARNGWIVLSEEETVVARYET